ncbi:MAG: DEAD/DEAH box helicase [Ruthenibacterium sp.]
MNLKHKVRISIAGKNDRLRMPITAKPYNHQQQAFDFACEKFGLLASHSNRSCGVALLMEMGCGKTIVSVALAGVLYQFGFIERVLVAAPLSILGVWQEEFEKFADFPYTLTILKGSSAKKKEQLQTKKADGLEIVVVNYESAWRLEKELQAFDADLIIADEAHKLKEARTAQSKAMHRLGDSAIYKLLLTGTVITNKELDVFSQYRFLNQEIFGNSFYVFRNKYFDMVGYGNHIPRFRKAMTQEFLHRLHSVAFRVTKAECLDLPEITEEIRTVELEPKTMKLYAELEKESYTALSGTEVSAVNVLTKLLRLCQLTGGHLTDDEGTVNTIGTAKLDALDDIIDSSMEENQKIVIMARFVPELNDIQHLLEKKKIGYAAVRGGVKNRAEEISRFQNDADCRVFVGQIAAAGLGITLTAASTMVFYSMDYSMSNFEQAKARIHRVSQKNACHYIYLIAKNTVDDKVLRALQSKVDLARILVDDYRKGLNPFKN